MALAASTSGALKAFIETLGLNIPAHRDRAPVGDVPPYVTIDEAVALVPDQLEDGVASTGRETVTIHVWMPWKGSDGKPIERYSLPSDLVRALQGQALPAAPGRAYSVIVQRAGPRLVEEETNLVHVPITAVVWRVI